MRVPPVTRSGPIADSLQRFVERFRGFTCVLGFPAVSVHMLSLLQDLKNLLVIGVLCRGTH